MKQWKNTFLLITGIGISFLGNWIYLVALNIDILNLTGSATAVAGLYVIRPIATLLTNTWSGSVIDRVDKQKLMIMVDVIRGCLILIIPFLSTLWIIYTLLFFINIFGSFFGPSSSFYITKLISEENRPRFNSIMGMTTSGAFLVGPAIAGILITFVGTEICMILNAISFFICAFCISLLPTIDEKVTKARDPISIATLINDWKSVVTFSKSASSFIIIYFLFQGALLLGFAVDSQEATFVKQHLLLGDSGFGLLLSIAGIGTICGSFMATLLVKKISMHLYLGYGLLLTMIGYGLFYFSNGFISAAIAFILLGFFMSFANTGYATLFQKNVPTTIMGRFGSITDMIQGIVQILLTLTLGFFPQLFSLQIVCLIFCGISILLSGILCSKVLTSSRTVFTTDAQLKDVN